MLGLGLTVILVVGLRGLGAVAATSRGAWGDAAGLRKKTSVEVWKERIDGRFW
jgi:hypothetical protein